MTQIGSEHHIETIQLKAQIEFKLRSYQESIESLNNLVSLMKKKSSVDDLLEPIFAMLVVRSYTRPNEALTYIEEHVLPTRYVKANIINRQNIHQLHFVDSSY